MAHRYAFPSSSSSSSSSYSFHDGRDMYEPARKGSYDGSYRREERHYSHEYRPRDYKENGRMEDGYSKRRVEDWDDRHATKRSRDIAPPYDSSLDQLQQTFKNVNDELKRYKHEVDHLHRLVDSSNAENSKLKREIAALEDELAKKKKQIKDERMEREDVFKENEYVISKLEEEVYRLRMAVAQVHLSHPLPLPLPLPLPMAHPAIPHIPHTNSLSQKAKEDIARNADRCVWMSRTTVKAEELAHALGGKSHVDSIYINPGTTSAFIILHNITHALEAITTIRTVFPVKYGLKVRVNLVNNAIWVGNLVVDEQSLYALCETCGPVESIRLLETNCGFVTYKDTYSAITAVCDIDGVVLGTAPLALNFKWNPLALDAAAPQPSTLPINNILYVGDLDPELQKEDILSMFGTYGNVQEVWTPSMGGYAFVTFETLEEAVVAKYHLQGKKLGTRTLRINYRRLRSTEESKIPHVPHSLIVKTKPKCEGAELRKLIGKYGKIDFMDKGSHDEWKIELGSSEEVVITKSHLNGRNVDGIQIAIEYVGAPMLKMEPMG